MANYVAIITTVGDLDTQTRAQKYGQLPDAYPVRVQEFDTIQEAEASCPGKMIMSVEQYNGYQKGTAMLYDHLANGKPWWRFW